jgi:hypothetical protein
MQLTSALGRGDLVRHARVMSVTAQSGHSSAQFACPLRADLALKRRSDGALRVVGIRTDLNTSKRKAR